MALEMKIESNSNDNCHKLQKNNKFLRKLPSSFALGQPKHKINQIDRKSFIKSILATQDVENPAIMKRFFIFGRSFVPSATQKKISDKRRRRENDRWTHNWMLIDVGSVRFSPSCYQRKGFRFYVLWMTCKHHQKFAVELCMPIKLPSWLFWIV